MSKQERMCRAVVFGILMLGLTAPFASADAQPAAPRQADKNGVVWYQPYETPLQLLGFKWFETNGKVYNRLDLTKSKGLRAGLSHTAGNTAGGQVRFRTDSQRVAVKVQLPKGGGMVHMPATGVSGFDLYMGPEGKQTYVATAKQDGAAYVQTLLDADTKEMRDITINFPLYNSVKSLEIGIDKDAKILEPTKFSNEGCVVVYGTSITQGGCVSRPGMAYPNILSRHLNVEVVNLGFSSLGKGDPAVAQMIAEIKDKRLVILDYEANATSTIQGNIGTFIKILREKEKDLPILVVSQIRMAFEQTSKKAFDKREGNRTFLKAMVEKTKSAGDRNIYFVDGSTILGEDWSECTVDAIHPTDLGHARMAESLKPVIAEILKKK